MSKSYQVGDRVKVTAKNILFAGQAGTVVRVLKSDHPRDVRVRVDQASFLFGDHCNFSSDEIARASE